MEQVQAQNMCRTAPVTLAENKTPRSKPEHLSLSLYFPLSLAHHPAALTGVVLLDPTAGFANAKANMDLNTGEANEIHCKVSFL